MGTLSSLSTPLSTDVSAVAGLSPTVSLICPLSAPVCAHTREAAQQLHTRHNKAPGTCLAKETWCRRTQILTGEEARSIRLYLRTGDETAAEGGEHDGYGDWRGSWPDLAVSGPA